MTNHFYERLIAAILLIASLSAYPQKNTINVIPKPNSIQYLKGSVDIKKIETICLNTKLAKSVKQMTMLKDVLGIEKVSFLEVTGNLNLKNKTAIIETLPKGSINDEGYKLEIAKGGIKISASTGTGFYYAITTLKQIIETSSVKGTKSIKLPAVLIIDEPRFAYRGVHLDACRHFFPVDSVKRYLDIMATYKMNRFHWHLTEDQGWRIQIDKYPELTTIGGYRRENDGNIYGGYYTKVDIREIVKYAAERHITVIPEIEMPGHARAALAAYPQFSCTGEKLPVANNWGVFEHVYCAGNDSTFEFLFNILDEVIDLFPGEYIHIGGDECPKEAWKKCEKCQARIQSEGLKDEHELQSYFIRRVENYLKSKGKKIIGWDEILEGGLAPDATVMSWRGIDGGIAAAKQGHHAIMTPGSHCYFDHYQAEATTQPKAICCFTDLQKVYSYDVIPADLDSAQASFILGAQANLWTEYIPTYSHLEYMLLPRMLALSEVVWTYPNNKDFEGFKLRVKPNLLMLKSKGINFYGGEFF